MKATSSPGECAVGGEQWLRYRFIRHLAELRGLRMKDLWRAFCQANEKVGYPFFTRVMKGERRSERVERWVSRYLKTPYRKLWAA